MTTKTKPTYIVIHPVQGPFLTSPSGGWSNEYPEAYLFPSQSAAEKAARKVGGMVAVNYGYENERIYTP